MVNVVTKYETCNTTDRYLLIGDYHEILSCHQSFESASLALAKIGSSGPDGLSGTRWASVVILAPGRSITGELWQTLPLDGHDEAQVGAALTEIFGMDILA